MNFSEVFSLSSLSSVTLPLLTTLRQKKGPDCHVLTTEKRPRKGSRKGSKRRHLLCSPCFTHSTSPSYFRYNAYTLHLHNSMIIMASSLLTAHCSSGFTISTSSISSTIRERRSITRRGLSAGNASLKLAIAGVELQRRLSLRRVMLCRAKAEEGERGEVATTTTTTGMDKDEEEEEMPVRSVTRVALWIMAAVYASYLFLLPFAPGDPVWAISPATITGVLNLSFNFFYVLPLANLVGFHLLEAAVVHPADEALFNFVLGWALLFAPLIFTDRKRNRFPGSLDVFWLASMFLTNTFLIPYMAIRLNKSPETQQQLQERSGLQRALTNGARVVAATGAAVGVLSVVWFIVGRPTEGYGGLTERWSYWIDAIANDRPTYAFLWDLCCFTVFQPWLIGDNLDNVRGASRELVGKLRFVPYVGLVAYCWGLGNSTDAKKVK